MLGQWRRGSDRVDEAGRHFRRARVDDFVTQGAGGRHAASRRGVDRRIDDGREQTFDHRQHADECGEHPVERLECTRERDGHGSCNGVGSSGKRAASWR